MAVPTTSFYTGKITSQHATKPKFVSTIAALVQPMVDAQDVLADMAAGIFDLDLATGTQLDQIGLWIGRSREVRVPLSGVYFSLDTVNLGFDAGNWQGPFDALTGVTLLDDTTYRALLHAKIIMNNWDGTVQQAAQALGLLFSVSPTSFITIQDNRDMTMTVGVSGVVPPAALISMLQNGEFDIQPVGVGITYSITSINTAALFGFDVESAAIAGFDVGSWSGQPGNTPGAVLGFSLFAVTSNLATFTWIAPETGTGPYTYQFEYQIAGGTGFILAPVTSTTTITISGLASAQSYIAQVYAVSTGGAGPLSSQILFTTSAGAPAQVTGLTELAATATSISLGWNVVSGATSYQVQYRLAGSATWLNWPTTTSATTLVATGLTTATIYDFAVYALNIFGIGTLSTTLTVGTVGSAPGTIVNLAATTIGQNSVALSWQNPTTGNGPFAFLVQYAINTLPVVYQSFTGTITLSALGGSCTIPNLQSGVTYLMQVAATNLGGSGPYSTALPVTTLSGPPNQVTGLLSSVINPTSVILSWNPVVNAVQYQIQFRQAGTVAWLNGPLIIAPTITGTVSGLLSGYTYQFRVYAIGP